MFPLDILTVLIQYLDFESYLCFKYEVLSVSYQNELNEYEKTLYSETKAKPLLTIDFSFKQMTLKKILDQLYIRASRPVLTLSIVKITKPYHLDLLTFHMNNFNSNNVIKELQVSHFHKCKYKIKYTANIETITLCKMNSSVNELIKKSNIRTMSFNGEELLLKIPYHILIRNVLILLPENAINDLELSEPQPYKFNPALHRTTKSLFYGVFHNLFSDYAKNAELIYNLFNTNSFNEIINDKKLLIDKIVSIDCNEMTIVFGHNSHDPNDTVYNFHTVYYMLYSLIQKKCSTKYTICLNIFDKVSRHMLFLMCETTKNIKVLHNKTKK